MTEHLTREALLDEVRAIDTATRTVDIIASDFSLDSYGTRIDPNGWDLEQFKKNPVICLQHDSYGESESMGLPIAKAIPDSIRVTDGKLVMKIQFPAEGQFPIADQVYALAKDGFLRGVSVGFTAEVWEDTEEDDGGYKMTVRVYRKQKLMEVSIVTIPSNDNAVIVRSMKRNLNAEDVKKQLTEVEAEFDNRTKLASYSATHAMKCIGYFERKQPVNKEAGKVMQRFFKRVLKTEPPADELEAWTRMSEAIDALQEVPEPKTEETTATVETPVVETKTEEITPVVPVPTESTPSPADVVPAAPAPQRSATVTVPLELLLSLPGQLVKNYMAEAEAALRRGVPLRKVGQLIDGMNHSVLTSLSTLSHGSDS